MKVIIHIFAVVAIIQALNETDSWEKFRTTFSKSYRNSAEEKQRYNIFLSNLLIIKAHNENFEKGKTSFRMGINKFTDLTPEELMERMKYSKDSITKFITKMVEVDFDGDLPTEVDWTKKGVVTEVKDQGHCACCWAFSTTGGLEGQHAIKTGKLVSLSEQQLVDCAKHYCNGCAGGNMNGALKYISQTEGIMLEKDYPYEERDDECRYNISLGAVQVETYATIKSEDESALKAAVATIGPISVGIEASRSFAYYESGIFDDPSCDDFLNHAVLVVGYGSENGRDYWLVKNSWGAKWGVDGYVKMTRNKNNQCGIASAALYPILK